jgi:hypothetical protein
LDDLDADPGSVVRQKELADLLEPRLTDDAAFAAELEDLIEACGRGSSPQARFITRLYDNSKVGQIVNVDHVNTFSAGDITMN